MIDKGIPPSREDWPGGVLEALLEWEQGDAVANPPLFYFADPSAPVWEATRSYGESSTEPEVVLPPAGLAPPFGLVTSQTCDIAEEERARPMRPWVQVAPVYELSEKGWKKKVRLGGGPRYWLHLPGLPDENHVWVADLRIELPIEKGWLAQQQRIQAFSDDVEKRKVGARLALLRGRPAFSRDFDSVVLTSLVASLEELDENSEVGRRLINGLEEVCVLLDSHLYPTKAQFVFLSDGQLDAQCQEWLQGWRESTVEAAKGVGITLHALDFQDLNALSASEYRRMTVVWAR